jgi:hypothetical protein
MKARNQHYADRKTTWGVNMKGQTNLFGFTEEEAKKYEETKDIKPTFNLGQLKVGDSVKFKLVSQEPKLVTVPDDEAPTGQREVYTVTAIDKLTGLECTIWLSSISLRMQLFQLYTKNRNTLKDLEINIAVREYDHPKYGRTRGYSVQKEIAK